MKVLLIHPPRENMITTNIPSVVDEERGANPPLGLLYVAAYARAHTRHDLQVLDCQALGIGQNEIENHVRAWKPDVVGIQAMTFTWIDARLTADAVQRAWPSCKVVLGGPHAHLYPLESLGVPSVDFVVQGEGEVPFARLLRETCLFRMWKGWRGGTREPGNCTVTPVRNP